MDDKTKDKPEESQSQVKKPVTPKRMPLPPFLRSIHKSQMWKKSSRKTVLAGDTSSQSPHEEEVAVQEEVLTLRSPTLETRNLYDGSPNSASYTQQKGYNFTMAKASFWTIVAALFFLGFLFFASGVFVAIYFFKEGAQPSSSENSWVDEAERKIGLGLVETVEDEVWKHAGNTAFTRAVMPNDSSQALSFSGGSSQAPSSQPASVQSSPAPSGDSAYPSSAHQGTLGLPPAPSPSLVQAPHGGASLGSGQETMASGSASPINSLPPAQLPSNAHQAADVRPSGPPLTEGEGSLNQAGEVQEIIQNPKARSPSYHTSPLAAAPTRDTQGRVLGSRKVAKEPSYTLNFGIFSTKQKAADRLKKLQRSHPKARIEEVTKGKKGSFLVVDGVYETEEGATQALRKLSKEDILFFSPKVQPETSESN